MKIKSLLLRNFRGIRDLKVADTKDNALFIGLNGTGKTTVLHAVQVALFDKCYANNGKALKVSELLGDDGKSADITLELDVAGDHYVIGVHITKNGKEVTFHCNDMLLPGTAKSLRTKMFEKAGIDEKHAQCAGLPSAFINSDDMADLIAELDGGVVTIDTIQEHLEDHAEWFNSWLKAAGMKLESLKDIAGIGKAFAEAQTANNASIKLHEQEIAETNKLDPPIGKNRKPLTVDDVPVVSNAIDKLTLQRDAIMEEKGGLNNLRPANTIRGEIDIEKSAIADLDNKIEVIKKALPGAEKALVKAIEEQEALTSELSSQGEAQAIATRKLAELNKSIEVFADGTCEQCKSALTEEQIEALTGAATKEVKLIEENMPKKKAYDALNKKCSQAIERRAKAQDERDNLSDESSGHKRQWLIHTNTMERLEKELSLASEASNKDSADELQAKADKLSSRITAAQGALDVLEKLQSGEASKVKLEKALETKAHIKWGLDLFRGGELKDKLGAGGRELLTAAANKILEPFGYGLSLSAGEAFLSRHGGTAVPMRSVSEGEYLIAQLAVACAFVKDGVTCLDGLEKLDGGNKGTFFTIVNSEGLKGLWMTAAYGQSGDLDTEKMSAGLPSTTVEWMGGQQITDDEDTY